MIDLIAEIGSSPAPAWNFRAWCLAARQAGATHVKAQVFRAEHFPAAEQASKRPLEFPRSRLGEFVEAAHDYGLRAGVSVFDAEAVQLAARTCDFLKLAGREQENGSLRAAVELSGKPVYRSIAHLAEFDWQAGEITLFAEPRYPTPLALAVWRLVTAARWFERRGWRWGWSSHTRGTVDCRLAARLGARAIEKHLALSETDLEAGHSLSPQEFGRMVRGIHG